MKFDPKFKAPAGKKGKKAMSAVETVSKVIKKTFKFFDENFTSQSKDIEVKFVPATTYAEALQRLNDEKTATAALNVALENLAVAEERKKVVGSLGLSKKAVLDFIKPFRGVPKYAALVTTEKGDAGWKDQYNKQTDAILADCKGNEFVMMNIRAAAQNASDDDTDEDNN